MIPTSTSPRVTSSSSVGRLQGIPGYARGKLSLPQKILESGLTDMVRISDARMGGTSYGTVILHVVPEAAVGGPLALIRSGDFISVDVPSRSPHVEVSDEALDARPTRWAPRVVPGSGCGWSHLYIEHMSQADEGLDLDFLAGESGVAGGPQAF